MGPLFVAFGWLLLSGVVFVPAFVISFVLLRSAPRAFVLAATFTVGAIGAFFAAFAVPTMLGYHEGIPDSGMWPALVGGYLAVSTLAGGVLAVYLRGWLSKYPPWRRY